ncbi:MAG: hypothetical protein JW751_00745 [Polyangiaceae bacterium]|nr:hypothetical protein [Polyangiaceae bacterium]
MDQGAAIQGIRYLESIPDSYAEATLPCPTDDWIIELVAAAVHASFDQRRAIFAAMTPGANGVLQLFAERMAMLSVRKRSPELLLRGLEAMMMVSDNSVETDRCMAMRLTLLYRSAERLGLGADAFFAAAVGHGVSDGGIPSFLEREPRNKSIDVMGYREMDGPSGLVYMGGDPSHIPAGLLFEKEPLIPPWLEQVFGTVESGDQYGPASVFASYREVRHRLAPEPIGRAEEWCLWLLRNGSHDSRVALTLGGLGARGAADAFRWHLSCTWGDLLGKFLMDVAVALVWLEPSLPALRHVLSGATSAHESVRSHALIALRYFECGEAVRLLHAAAVNDGDYYALESLTTLCAPSGDVDHGALFRKLRERDPAEREAATAMLHALIARRALPDRIG